MSLVLQLLSCFIFCRYMNKNFIALHSPFTLLRVVLTFINMRMTILPQNDMVGSGEFHTLFTCTIIHKRSLYLRTGLEK